MGSGEWGMGSGEWGMGNGEWGMGKIEIHIRCKLRVENLSVSLMIPK
ncbi:MAG: hypothetical protein ACYTXP_09355 [Nostoc sp.]